MKKPLVIISACQFTRLALESLIPTDRYIVRVYSNVTTEVEFVLKTSCGYLLADIPSLPSGELVLLACLARLRSDAGQWICPYISRHLLSLNPSLAHCRRYSRGER